MKPENFTPGQGVTYQPHPDAKPIKGTVTRTNQKFVFVNYDTDPHDRAKATPPEKLQPMGAYYE